MVARGGNDDTVVLGPNTVTGDRGHDGDDGVVKQKEGDEAKVVTRVQWRGSMAIAGDEENSSGGDGLLEGDDEEGRTGDGRVSTR